ncbi:RHS repeat-associated core domain-containing protein [Phocaeicola vulgatus]|uniref:RHS repeat domain-containing protein n=1 Tax=Phocaeicola vulgatus TaxID=821 RepID=UPI0032C15F18
MGYDKFEQRTYLKYCNGAETFYTYEPARRRLQNLTVNAGGKSIMDNGYTYDAVSNVLSVANKAALPESGKAGGQMAHAYTYDALYRLASATGTYAGADSKTASYRLEMGYDNMHRIVSKKQHLTQQGVQFDGTLHVGYDLAYTYGKTEGKKFQLAEVKDANYRTEENPDSVAKIDNNHTYTYDANGNLVYVNTGRIKQDGTLDSTAAERKLRWDEENRLTASDDNGFVTNYWYDADGERTVKTSGEGEQLYVNSEFASGRTNTAKFSLYVSPYLVANQGGRYTKHIYIGSQRIVSKIGDFASYGSDPRRIQYAGSETDGLSVNYKQKYSSQQQAIKDNYAIFEVPYNGTDNNDYVDGQGFCCDDGSPEAAQARALTLENNFQDPDAYEKLQFYYHPDHLGSSSYITNLDGEVVQHIEYVPFGEVFIEERNSIWNTPYLFNAKEFDEETGLYYYGARYYDPRLSLWMSTDKSAIIAPGYSPYTFCKNNPNIMVDPNGNFPIFINGRTSNDTERGSASYWSMGLLEVVKQKTGYYYSQFKYVDGNQGFWPSSRFNAGIAQGKADAAAIYAVLKSSAKDGVITEQLQIISHSRGSAFASGYMQSVSAEIRDLANKDNMSFSYGSDKIVEYSINIGPHQSNHISYEESGTLNVNISHFGDILSGNDASGNVINTHSCMDGLEQHGNATFIPELEFVLPVLEAGGPKSDIKKQLINLYQQWNQKHPIQIKSTVE